MRSIFVCPDEFLWRLLADAGESHFEPVHVVEQPRARTLIMQRGGTALAGHLEQENLYRRAFRTGQEPVLVAVDRARQARVVGAIRRAAPDAPIVTLGDAIDTLSERVLDPALDRALTRMRVARIRAHFAAAQHVLILMQDDPDPDAPDSDAPSSPRIGDLSNDGLARDRRASCGWGRDLGGLAC